MTCDHHLIDIWKWHHQRYSARRWAKRETVVCRNFYLRQTDIDRCFPRGALRTNLPVPTALTFVQNIPGRRRTSNNGSEGGEHMMSLSHVVVAGDVGKRSHAAIVQTHHVKPWTPLLLTLSHKLQIWNDLFSFRLMSFCVFSPTCLHNSHNTRLVSTGGGIVPIPLPFHRLHSAATTQICTKSPVLPIYFRFLLL